MISLRGVRWIAIAAVTAAATFAGVSAVANSQESEPAVEPAPIAEEEAQSAEALRREGLTKILSNMEYNGASEEQMAPIREELETLGGPNPNVEPIDGPDNQAEWELQARIDKDLCESGHEQSCEDLKHSQEMAER
jgi:hypothetical protein